MTTTAPAPVTVSSSANAPRHRKEGPVKYGPRKVRAVARRVVTATAFTALAGRTHLDTTETQR
jgi:hypothetical protein